MRVYIPYRTENPKTRLSSTLPPKERQELSRKMLMDVYQTISEVGHNPIVLATESVDLDVRTTISKAPLSEAVNSILPSGVCQQPGAGEGSEYPVGIVMADLGLVTVDALQQLFAPDTALTIAPGQRGGTNAIVTHSPKFRVNYHGASLQDHREIADTNELGVTEVDSYKLACDIDQPSDVIDLFLHGQGQAGRYLRSLFRIDKTDGTLISRDCLSNSQQRSLQISHSEIVPEPPSCDEN